VTLIPPDTIRSRPGFRKQWFAAALSLVLISGLLLAVSVVPAAAQHVFPGERWERIEDPALVGYDPARLDAIHPYVDGLNTTAVMVIVGGRVLFEHGDVERVSYIASVRKSILAMLYGNYVESGAIDLQKTLEDLGMDDVGGLLPIELRAKVWDLITARSGVYHPASNPGDNLADAPPRGSQEPGTYLLYSNWDFNAAGAAFELMSGVDIFDALQTDIMEPVGARDFERRRHRKAGDMSRSRYPAYHMHLSTRDMARVGYLMLREGNWNGRQLVPREWTHTISGVVTPSEEIHPDSRRDGEFGYGCMWWVWDGPEVEEDLIGGYRAQGIYGQWIIVIPSLDMVIAHKTAVPPNRSTSWREFRGIIERLLAARTERIPN